MNIGIDARLRDGRSGGVQQIIIGLAQGFRNIQPSSCKLFFIMEEGHSEWLRPYLPSNGKVIEVSSTKPATPGPKSVMIRLIRSTVGHTLARKYFRLPPEPPELSRYSLDLIHFVHQRPFKTSKPFIFMPQDLQHEYYPQYFSKREVVVRRELYRKCASRATRVVCISQAAKADVLRYLEVPERKTRIIYCAPPTAGYGGVSEEGCRLVREKYKLPEEFILYPAKTFPHKNHKRLLSALNLLNKKPGEGVNLVCTGTLTPYFHSELEPMVRKLELQDRTIFTEFINPNELNHIYNLASAVVFPSEFEGFGMPVVEAFTFGKAVACSNASCLPEICGDAALLFPPDNVQAMASAIHSITQDEALRNQLQRKARMRASTFSWEKSAEQFHTLYREIHTESHSLESSQ